MSRSFAFLFVCQQGELEIKASLLAASLARFVRCQYELIATIPSPAEKWGTIHPRTMGFLQKLGARIVPISNPIGMHYPIGNKLDCFRIPVNADKRIFMDTDMLMMRDFCDASRFGIAVNACAADRRIFTRNETLWRQVYHECDAAIPTWRVSIKGQSSLPYFNSGFVCSPNDTKLGETWVNCSRQIDRMPKLPHKRLHLDQITLPPAIAKLELKVDMLDDCYNHPTAIKAINEADLPIVSHYHKLDVVAREPALLSLVRSLLAEYTELRTILETDPRWQAIV